MVNFFVKTSSSLCKKPPIFSLKIFLKSQHRSQTKLFEAFEADGDFLQSHSVEKSLSFGLHAADAHSLLKKRID
jgi:hypothetical protein